MIGVGPHQMSMADRVFLGALQFGLVLAAAIAMALWALVVFNSLRASREQAAGVEPRAREVAP